LERAAIAAASTSPDRARVVADALLAGGAIPTLEPLIAANDVLDATAKKPVTDTIERIAASVVPAFVALVRHPAIEVRTRAVEFLAQRPEASAQSAIVDALADPEESVRRAALAAIGNIKDAGTLAAVAKVGREAQSWPLRVRAAEALGRLGAGADSKMASETLAIMAKTDEYALVREPALRSLVALDKQAADAVLREVAEKDTEPRIRAIATELLAGQTAKP
jgi:HEAT repeat protein